MPLEKKIIPYLIVLCLFSALLIMCQSHKGIIKHSEGTSGELLGIFKEKFRRVIKNADGKIDVQLELSHKDGLYIEGDSPYVFMTVNKKAHVRLLYVTASGEVLQKFPPLVYKDSELINQFVSDYFEAGIRHRIPKQGDPYKYVVKVPESKENVQEIAIALASTVSFTEIDSLILEKQERISEGEKESPLKDTSVNLGFILFPETTILMWAPLVFDLFKDIFIHRRSGYKFGYAYRVITIKK